MDEVNPRQERLPVAILGSGNIGTDLMYKVARNNSLELKIVAGIDPNSEGLARAKESGYATSASGLDAILECSGVRLVFDATSARSHVVHATRLREAGIIAIDLTPAKVGPSVVPCVNMLSCLNEPNVNLISCGAQATVPIVHAIRQLGEIDYAEIVSTVASRSAGPGTRQNIDEFTRTTAAGLTEVGGARTAKAIIVLNPADPPIIMRNTIYVKPARQLDEEMVKRSVLAAAKTLNEYVPGYEIVVEPFVNGDHVVVGVEVTGAGDYLPKYAGNLDIITAAAVAVAEQHRAAMMPN